MTEQSEGRKFTLGLAAHFDGAHCIRGHRGKCADLHGHRWDLEVVLRGTELDGLGMIMDFSDLKRALHSVVEDYDHSFLNDREPFTVINPTAENLARHLFERLGPLLPGNCSLLSVKVWESPGMWACYGE